MQDPVRQTMLARMGIQCWQLRRPALLDGGGQPDRADNAPLPTGKLWLLASQWPATALLTDICHLLGIALDEVSLLDTLPPADTQSAEQRPLLWLTQANPAWPNALICPLTPNAEQKRALWQQLRQHLVTREA